MTLWLDAMGASVSYYDAGGVRTRCLEAGTGEAVIFLHGIGGHLEAFAKNIVPLSDQYRAIAVDMLGHGLTDGPDCEYLIPDYAKHLVNLLDAMGIQKAHLVGESLGAWVSYWAWRTDPERVLSFTSVVGAGLKVGGFDNLRSDGVAELRKRSSKASAGPTRETIRSRLAWLFHEPDKFASDELVEVRYRIWSNPNRSLAQTRIANMLNPELGEKFYMTEEELKKIDVPTYFLWTEFNPTTPWQTAKEASGYVEGARFDVMPNCGHWPQYEDPDEFHRRMRSFLESVSSE